MLTLCYYGPFATLRDDVPVAPPTQPCALLLAYLGLSPGRPIMRLELARRVWPDASDDRATANFRNALTMLRHTYGPELFVADRKTVHLSPEAVESDWSTAAILRERARIETDDDRLEEALRHFLDLSCGTFLEGWDASWIRPLRVESDRTVARALLNLAQLRLSMGDPREARELAGRARRLTPRSELAISVMMRASVALGEPAEACVLFDHFRSRAEAVSPELTAFAAELRRMHPPAAVHPPASPETINFLDDALAEAYEIGLSDDPDTTVQFLLSTRDSWRRRRNVERGKQLLTAALDANISPPIRERALVTLGVLNYRTSDYKESLEAFAAARHLRAEDSSPDAALRNAATASAEALVHMDLRHWEESERMMAQVIADCPEHSRPWLECMVNRAGLSWHQLRCDEARVQYQAVMDLALQNSTEMPAVRAFLEGNLACLGVVEGDWDAAEKFAEAARKTLTLRMDALYAAGPVAIHALARIAHGDRACASELATVALDPVRLRARRFAQVLYDYVAEGAAFLGEGAMAREILRASTDLRLSIGHFRSPAEESVRTRILHRAEQHSGRPIAPVPTGTTDDHAALATWIAESLRP